MTWVGEIRAPGQKRGNVGLSGRSGRRETSSAGSLPQSLGEARAHSVLAALVCPAHAQGISWASGRFDRSQVIFVTPEHNFRFLLLSVALPPTPSLLKSIISFNIQRIVDRSPSRKEKAIKTNGVTKDRRKTPWFFSLYSRDLG